MNVLLIPRGKNLIEEIIPALRKAGHDYSTNLVVFPGKRPSHFLRKALAREIRGSFVPPAVFSMDEFIDLLCQSSLPGRKLESIDAVSILYDIHCKAVQPLGGESFMTPESFFPLGLKIYRDIEELYIEGIDHRLVRETEAYPEEMMPQQTLKRLQSLSFFYQKFYEIIRESGYSTRSLRYRSAAELAGSETDEFQQVIFAGFFALTRSEKALFRRMLSKENTLFIFQDGKGMRERLAELGISKEILFVAPSPFSPRLREGSEEEGEETGPEVRFYSSSDAHGQVSALYTVLETDKEQNRSSLENTAIVLPSPDMLFPLLRQGLSMIDEESYNISLGYPLQRTPVFAFLNSLMEVVTNMEGNRLYIPDYLNFVLHPYTKNIYFGGSAEITRIIFHAIEEVLTKNRMRTFISLEEIEEDDKITGLITGRIHQEEKAVTGEMIKDHLKSIHLNTIEKFSSFRNVRDFSLKCTELLSYIFNNSTAKLHPLFFPFSESFIRALEIISGSLMKDTAFAELQSYFIFFRKYIMTCYTPFEGTPLRGLQVLGFLETRNLRFERVFVLDLNEEVLPDTRKEDSLLPFKTRQVLGLPTYRDRDRLVEYNFESLIYGAKEVHLFFIENDKKERSRFVENLLWNVQKKDRITDTKKYLKSIQYEIELKNCLPAEIRKTDAVLGFLRDFTYSASALDSYLQCSLRFYYSFILKMDKREEVSGGIDRMDIGKIVHDILSQYFSEIRGRCLKPGDIDVSRLNALTDNLFGKEFGQNSGGAIYLLKKQTKRHLTDFLEKYFLPLTRDEELTILDCEKDLHIRKATFSLRGRIDAIWKRGEKTIIVDYKTGSNPAFLKINFDKLDLLRRETWHGAIGSIQLPLYLMLYSTQNSKSIRELNGMFLLLGRSMMDREIELSLFEGDEGEEKYGIMENLLFRLLEEIINPEIPFTPAPESKKICPDCNYQSICGTQWIVK